ncbi:MAG TPA: hypothetical protein VNV85_02430 [Puia sp.]|jgi:hypothetical protein|nr:hypothetical protein [Puia sp.]
MKKKILLFATVLFVVSFFQAHAQINKGSILLGGQINFYTQTISPDQKSNWINVTPAIGKAIKDNLIVGIDVNYARSSNVMGVPNNQTSNLFGAGVFLRRYVQLGKGFYVFGQERFGASYNTSKTN